MFWRMFSAWTVWVFAVVPFFITSYFILFNYFTYLFIFTILETLVCHLVLVTLVFQWKVCTYQFVIIADWIRPLCYISVCVLFRAEFLYFPCFLKCYISCILHLHNFPLFGIHCKFLNRNTCPLSSLSIDIRWNNLLVWVAVWATHFTCKPFQYLPRWSTCFWHLKHLKAAGMYCSSYSIIFALMNL